MARDYPRDSERQRSTVSCSDEGRRRSGGTSYLELLDYRHLLWLAVTTDYLELVDWHHVGLLAATHGYRRLRKNDCYLVRTGSRDCYCHKGCFRDGPGCVAMHLALESGAAKSYWLHSGSSC